MANEKNLIKNEDLTPMQRRQNASKAGKASVKTRREKKTIQTLLNDLLNNPCIDNPQFEKLAQKLGLESDQKRKQLFYYSYDYKHTKKGEFRRFKNTCWITR